MRTIVPGGRYEDIDLVLIRENTEGLYVGVEHYIGLEGDPRAAAESVMIVTRFGAERIVRYAFEYARANGRKKITLAHKANILKYTQGLFLDVGREMAPEYPDIAWEDRIIDATAMALVLEPRQFDVLVMENMFGDILSDLMAGLVGGLGFAPAGNIGEDAAVFEAVHGFGSGYRGAGDRQPDWTPPVGVSASRACRSARRGRPHPGGARSRGSRGRGKDEGHGGPGLDGRVQRCPGAGAGVIRKDLDSLEATCLRCLQTKPRHDLDRMLWCDACNEGVRALACEAMTGVIWQRLSMH